jgi:phage terminase large subunit-like protein
VREIRKLRTHPHCRAAEKYANEVVSGKIDACRLTFLACKRFLDDLANKSFKYRFNRDRADRFCNFVEFMPHVKGKWAGTPLKLEPWQSFMFANLFGWEDERGLRRFRRAFVFLPRKNGKTTCAAPLGLGMLTVEAEPGAEIYCGATNEDQADEVFRPAKAMAERAKGFKQAYNVNVAASSIYREDGLSFFKRLIGKPGEGQSPYCAIHDEYHEHKTSDQVDSMDTGMGARQEPLQFIITTAGRDVSGPCKDLHDYAVKVLEGHFENESFFALLYGIDPEDDWTDIRVWKKANPNYGVSVSEEYLKGKLAEAIQRTSLQNTVKTKHLNLWVNAGIGWLNMAKWNDNADTSLALHNFTGCRAWIGIDLASKIDLTAMMILIRFEEKWYLFGKYYLPRETIDLPGNEHYQRWEQEGWLTGTPGARTDYQYLYDDLLGEDNGGGLYGDLQIEEIVYDPREAEYLMQSIRDKVSCPVVEFTQSASNLSEPMKEFEAEVNSGHILHSGDPVLQWSAGNVVLKEAAKKMYYPAKENAASKIDPMVAAIMAMARAKATVENDEVTQGFVEL